MLTNDLPLPSSLSTIDLTAGLGKGVEEGDEDVVDILFAEVSENPPEAKLYVHQWIFSSKDAAVIPAQK